MSRVFVAIDRALGRKVVVKVLPPELAAGVNRERFRREIQVAAQLQHPHIVPLLSAGEQGDLLWYTMPFIDGESLRTALERKKPFSVREVTRIMHDVVDALAFAHARGVIHRDIKPGNILRQGSHALVTDFGVAKALSAAMPISGVTSAGIAIGTPAYMAPEQLAGDAAADHRIDIYAVGLLAYELLTGSSPFTGPSPRETLAAQLTRDPKPLHEVSPEVPRTLSALIMRCLAKDPAARPQTRRGDPSRARRDDDAARRHASERRRRNQASPPVGRDPSRDRRGPRGRRRVVRTFSTRSSVESKARLGRRGSGGDQAHSDGADRTNQSRAVRRRAGDRRRHRRPHRPSRSSRTRIPSASPRSCESDSPRPRLRDSITQARLQAEAERKMMDSIIAANGGAAASSDRSAATRHHRAAAAASVARGRSPRTRRR